MATKRTSRVPSFLQRNLQKVKVEMNDNGQRDNGRHKADQCKSNHAQWMVPPYQMKDSYTMKMIAMMAERDTALQERNKALAEKREALSERDKSYLQRDAALAERNNAIMERDKAFAALESLGYSRENGVTDNGGSGCPSGCNVPLVMKHTHHLHHQQHQHQHQQQPHPHTTQLSDALFDHEREMNMNNVFPISTASPKTRRGRRPKKETNVQAVQPRKPLKMPRKRTKKSEATGGDRGVPKAKPLEWKGQDLGLNLVAFDDTTMPVPVCSCTGEFHQCYKWGNGGWQSACCTMTMSLFPLPMIPNKRHTRVGGRKMSGSAFSKLLSRLAAEGHDLSVPLDLKDHWAKHGTNRYITIK